VTRRGAALLLAGVACAAAWPGVAPAPQPCAAPGRGVSRGTLASVRCDAASERPLQSGARLLFGLALDLNEADARALEALPGVGPGRAAAIVRERGRAPFCRLEDLDRVPGFGPATLARVAGLATAACPGSRS
jgi:competence protein ComEA